MVGRRAGCMLTLGVEGESRAIHYDPTRVDLSIVLNEIEWSHRSFAKV